MRGKRILINPIDDYCDCKGELFMTKKISTNDEIMYRMSNTMAQSFLKTRKGPEKKMSTNDFLCKIVNETFGLKGHCVKVIIVQ